MVDDPGPAVARVGSMDGMLTVVEVAGVVLINTGMGGETGVRFCPGSV